MEKLQIREEVEEKKKEQSCLLADILGPSQLVFLVLFIMQFLLGMLGNGFIGLVNGSGWLKRGRISLPDFIITSLALCRIVLLCILLADGVTLVFLPAIPSEGVMMQVIDVFWTFTNHLSIWITTCLGILYCLKIASFSHPTFLWLKWRVSRVIMWMMLGALFFSCSNTVSLIHEFHIYSVLRGINSTGNVTEHFRKKNKYEMIHVLGTLWHFPPLVLSLASYLLLILSLGKHTQQMRQNGTNASDSSTEAHKRAIKIIFSFFFLFLFYFLAFLITSSSSFLPGTMMTKMFGELLTMIYPAGHSYILILGNNKLKQTFVEMLGCASAHRKTGSKGPFSLENGRGDRREPRSPSAWPKATELPDPLLVPAL